MVEEGPAGEDGSAAGSALADEFVSEPVGSAERDALSDAPATAPVESVPEPTEPPTGQAPLPPEPTDRPRPSVPSPGGTGPPPPPPSGSERFFNRELSWLEFDSRVLALAADEATPVLDNVLELKDMSAVAAAREELCEALRPGGAP